MDYKAIIKTETLDLKFGSNSKIRLLKRVLKNIKKLSQDETITLSTLIKGYINGYECYTPCYPCEQYVVEFSKEELQKKLEDYLTRANSLY